MKKHAYLIIAHKVDDVFLTLLRLLDAPENDLFVHMDKKCLTFSNDCYMARFCKLVYTERTCVTWGGYSQINAEMLLLREAVKGDYSYYHLLSGGDLPLKPHKQIYDFFENSDNAIFVDYMYDEMDNHFRTGQYHLFQELLGRNYFCLANRAFLKLQRIMHIRRNAEVKFGKGSNWFSIPDDFAKYVVSKSAWIKNVFRYTFCCDEMFLQTVLLNSPYIERLYYKGFDNNKKANVREIDWKRGSPYIFRTNDFDGLIKSEMMYARKFDSNVDGQIVTKLYEYLTSCEYRK